MADTPEPFALLKLHERLGMAPDETMDCEAVEAYYRTPEGTC